ncbi:hypothetical protein NDU88_010789 [Pleurodeles waltl]|uniref:Uncharacterized protein n=1 Tax=Pleurodeles waltl TaxID=8319 RepID=A0AAV7S2W8_PLEWA|nr:hypothetical protein NDU88_010789 [Pleurodeles waltl]
MPLPRNTAGQCSELDGPPLLSEGLLPSLLTFVGAPAPPAPALCSPSWGAQPERPGGGGVRAKNRTRPTWCCRAERWLRSRFYQAMAQQPDGAPGLRMSLSAGRRGAPHGSERPTRLACRGGGPMLLTPGTTSEPLLPSFFSVDDAGLRMARSSPL